MKHPVGVVLALLLSAWPTRADFVILKNGGKLEGNVVREDEIVVEISMRFGKVTVPRGQVVSIEEAPTLDEVYAERAAALPAHDAVAALALADWARAHDLSAEAVTHYVEAYRLDSSLTRAADVLESMDWHQVDGQWVDPDTYYRGLGWVRRDGRWIHPLEQAWREAQEEAAAAARPAESLRRRVEDARDQAARVAAAIAESDRAGDLLAERVRDADAALGNARTAAADAARAWERSRFEVQRAQAVHDLERVRADRGEPNRLELAYAELLRALRAAGSAERAVAKAEARIRSGEQALRKGITEQDRAARMARDAGRELQRAEDAIRAAEREAEAAESELARLRAREQAARARFEELQPRR